MATPAVTDLPAPRTLNFGTTATASLLAKMTITHSTNVHRDQVIIYSMFDRLMRGAMPQTQEELNAAMADEGEQELLIDKLANSYVYDKMVTNVQLMVKITDTKLEYSHLYATPSLLPYWDTIYAVSTSVFTSPSPSARRSRFADASSASAASNVLVTNCEPPRINSKMGDSQIYLTLVALEHSVERLDFAQMTALTNDHPGLSVHWSSTVIRSEGSSHAESEIILSYLSKVKSLFDPSHSHHKVGSGLEKITQRSGEKPRDYLIRFQKKLIQLEDAAVISGTESEHSIIHSITEQVKQSKKGMASDFKQHLKIQMHAKGKTSFTDFDDYLKFVTSLQRAVYSDDEASTDDDETILLKKKSPGNTRLLNTNNGMTLDADARVKRTPKQVSLTAIWMKTASGQAMQEAAKSSVSSISTR